MIFKYGLYQYSRIVKVLLISLCLYNVANCMVYDNRYFPLYAKKFIRDPEKRSFIAIQPVYMYADRAFGFNKEIGLPEINGLHDEVHPEISSSFDLSELAKALVRSKCVDSNPLRSDLLGRNIPWDREGLLTAQGAAFYYEQALTCYLSLGFTALVLRYNNNHDFLFYQDCLGSINQGQQDYLFELKNKINNILGLSPPVYSDINFGDIDLYLRLSNYWEYACRCRLINTGLSFGTLIPTAPAKNIDNPAALPIGGNGHWGIYGQLDMQFELREDLLIGLLARASKRLKKAGEYRMPSLREPSFYGTIVGKAIVDPGATYVFAPYAKIAGFYDMFGFGVGYTMVIHESDSIIDCRENQCIPSMLTGVTRNSQWQAEYVTVSAFWDFGVGYEEPNIRPKLTFAWDIPTQFTVAKQVPQTNAVSLILYMDY